MHQGYKVFPELLEAQVCQARMVNADLRVNEDPRGHRDNLD